MSVPQGTTSSLECTTGVQLTHVRALEVHGICIPGGAFEVRCDQGTSECVYIIVLLFQSLILCIIIVILHFVFTSLIHVHAYIHLCIYVHAYTYVCIHLCTCIHFAAKEIQIGIISIYKHHALVRIPS